MKVKETRTLFNLYGDQNVINSSAYSSLMSNYPENEAPDALRQSALDGSREDPSDSFYFSVNQSQYQKFRHQRVRMRAIGLDGSMLEKTKAVESKEVSAQGVKVPKNNEGVKSSEKAGAKEAGTGVTRKQARIFRN